MRRLLILDVETTGLAADAEVVEICLIEILPDLTPVWEFVSLIRPIKPVSLSAFQVHGITEAELISAPSLDEVFRTYLHTQDFSNVVLISHNVKFDRRFVLDRMTIEEELCTVQAARRYLPEIENHKLQTLREALSLDVPPGEHRAYADTCTTLSLLHTLVERSGLSVDGIIADMKIPRAIKVMPWGKHAGMLIRFLPFGYKKWLLGLPDLDPDIRFTLEGGK